MVPVLSAQRHFITVLARCASTTLILLRSDLQFRGQPRYESTTASKPIARAFVLHRAVTRHPVSSIGRKSRSAGFVKVMCANRRKIYEKGLVMFVSVVGVSPACITRGKVSAGGRTRLWADQGSQWRRVLGFFSVMIVVASICMLNR